MKISTISLENLELELTFDPDRNENTLFMVLSDATATVRDGDEKLGRIAAIIGGGIELSDTATGKSYRLTYEELWRSFQDALQKKEVQSDG